MKQVYLTSYQSKKYNNTFGSYVLARSEQEAECKIKKRNIGEVLEGTIPIPVDNYSIIDSVVLFDKSHYRSCLHAVTFMAYVLASAGEIDPIEALSDQGIVHEILHLATNIYDNQNNYIYDVIRKDLVSFQALFDNLTH